MSSRRQINRLLPFVGLVGAFLWLWYQVSATGVLFWDPPLSHWIQAFDHPLVDSSMRAVSWLGAGWTPYWVVGGGCLLMAWLRRHWEAAVCSGGVGIGALLNRLLKWLIGRPRPDATLVNVLIVYPNESFPSGHVSLFVEFFGFLAFLSLAGGRSLPRLAAAAGCGLLIVSVGPSRVYLGAHWPSDVLAGYLWGIAWLLIMIGVFRRHPFRRTR